MKVYLYKKDSGSGSRLAAALADHEAEWTVNWGAGRYCGPCEAVINRPEAVARACSKTVAFRAFRMYGVPTPRFTTDTAIAQGWVASGTTVLARADGLSNGAGIQRVRPGEVVPDADFYTAFIDGVQPWRVHAAFDRVLGIQRPDVNGVLRLVNPSGWRLSFRQAVEEAAVRAVRSLGLDFGAVDFGALPGSTEFVVFEVNTAPLLGEQTCARYADAIRQVTA